MRTAQPAYFVDRQRLRARLERSSQLPVTLIIAPPGCGKSVALTQFLATCNARWLRYSVRPDNNGLLGFARGLADTIAALEPRARAGISEAVTTASASDSPASTLAAWFAAHLRSHNGLVAIDDLHICQNEAVCVAFLVQLIERTKDHIAWILASRSSLHLPVPDWIARGDSSFEIGEADLRFTHDEAAEAARGTGVDLPDDVVEQLLTTTSGWATALALALRVAEVSTDLAHLSFAARDLSYRYLADHVYRTLHENERELLQVCAVLPEIDVRVLEAAGFHRPQAMLEELRTRIHVVSAADDGAPGRYRCHDLFRDFLVHQLELLGGDDARTVRMRAARALQSTGETVAALRIFASAGAIDDVLSVLRDEGFSLGLHGHGDSLSYAIAALPDNVRHSEPIVLAIRGTLEVLAGHYQQGEILLDSALVAVPRSDRILRAMITSRSSVCKFNLGKAPVPDLDELVNDGDLPLALQGDLLSIVAIAQARAGELANISKLLDRIESIAARVDSAYAKATMLQRVGVAAVYSGELERGLRVLPLATHHASDCGMYRAATFTLTTLGSTMMLSGADPALALACMREAREAADKSQERHYRLAATIGILDAEFLIGDIEAVRAVVEECRELGVEELDRGTADKAGALIAAHNGEFGAALECMQRAFASPHFNEYPLLGRSLLVMFAVLAHDDKSPTFLSELQMALAEGSASPAAIRFFDVATATSDFANAALGNDKVARAEAGKALRRSRYGVFTRLLELYEPSGTHARVSLTPTEISILRALDAGKSPKEIANEQGCSINTVRWHIRRAIEKFECSGSAQAIRVARSRGLL